MSIIIGNSQVSGVYFGLKRVKHIYLGTSLVYSDTCKLTLNIGTGVGFVQITTTTVDGKSSTTTYTTSKVIACPYGAKLKFSPSSQTGYKLDSYTTETTITADSTISFTASALTYYTPVNVCYSGTEYGNSMGDKIGTFQYSTNGSSWSGNVSDQTWGSSTKFTFGSYLYIRNITAAPGFYLSSVTYNGKTISASGGVYKIQIANGSYSVLINLSSTQSTSNISWSQTESTTTNRLNRTAWSVQANINVKIKKCDAGVVLGTIPYQYRPKSDYKVNVDFNFRTQQGTSNTTVTKANITFKSNGNIVSDVAATGTASGGGGGKWGSYYYNDETKISGTFSWSIR